MTQRAPTYLRQRGDGEGLMPRQGSIILHLGVVKAERNLRPVMRPRQQTICVSFSGADAV
jgi:hypothetical protein